MAGFFGVRGVVCADAEDARRVGQRGVDADLGEWVRGVGDAGGRGGDAGGDDGECVFTAAGEIEDEVAVFKQCAGTDETVVDGKRDQFHGRLPLQGLKPADISVFLGAAEAAP